MLLTCNPDPDSFIREWIEWWLDDEGYPIHERSGVKRWYVENDNQMYFADTEEELREKYPEFLRVFNPKTKNHIEVPPSTITFIAGTIFDNPALIEANPKYLSKLNSLPKIERARLLEGNWYVRPEGSNYFLRQWLNKVDKLPRGVVGCRAWDKASSEPSEVNTHPDFTASIKMFKDKDGNFYIVGDYAPTCKDKKDPEIVGKFRETPGARDTKILEQAKHDGTDIKIVLSQDPGSAGATEYQESAKKLITEGFSVQKDPMPSSTSKLARYSPFSSACENGMVCILEHTFDKKTLEMIYKENEAFDGERSTRTRKDDWPDATASAFNWLCKKAVIPKFTLEDFSRNDPFNFSGR